MLEQNNLTVSYGESIGTNEFNQLPLQDIIDTIKSSNDLEDKIKRIRSLKSNDEILWCLD